MRKLRGYILFAVAAYCFAKAYETSKRRYPLGDTTMPIVNEPETEPVDIPVDRVEVVVAQAQNGKGGRS